MNSISTPITKDTRLVSAKMFQVRRFGRKVAALLFDLNKQRIDNSKYTPKFPSGGVVSGNCPPGIDSLPRQFTLNRESRGEYIIPSEPSEVRKLKNNMYDRIINGR